METKQCKVCQAIKPLTEFCKASTYKDKVYYRGECRECTRTFQRSEKGHEYQRRHRQTEKRRLRSLELKRQPKYKAKSNKQQRERYRNDPLFALKKKLRARLHIALRQKTWKKNDKFNEYICCDAETLVKHIESQFTDGMSWALFLTGKIHLDHIYSLSLAKTEEEMYKLCHYTNLQPLWAEDNMKKSNKLP